jgi:hypothetical protein
MAPWLAAAALAGLLALGMRRVLLGYAAPPFEAKELSRREYATLAAAARATFPPGGEIPPSGLDAAIPSWVDRYLGAASSRTRLLLRMLLFLVEHATLLFPAPGRGGLRRFSSLSPAQQIAYLQGWRRSKLFVRRTVFLSLRAILTMGYFADPAVLRSLGLLPRAIETPVIDADLLWPRVGRGPETIPFTHADLKPPAEQTPLGPYGPADPRYEGSGR